MYPAAVLLGSNLSAATGETNEAGGPACLPLLF